MDVKEKKGSVILTQHRFLQDGALDPEDGKMVYPLSLQVRTKEGINGGVTLHKRTKVLQVSEFFKFNAGHTSFYRAEYSRE